MIENLRKYTGLIIVVIVVLLIGFIFMGSSSLFRQQSIGGGTFVQVDGRGYSQSEFLNLGKSPMGLVRELRAFDYRRMTPNDLEVMQFANRLASGAESQDAAEMQFFAARVVIRDARDKFGIHPSAEDVETFVQSLSAFQSPPPVGAPPGTQGTFDQVAYNNFTKTRLGGYGLAERDFQELIRDIIATSKLHDLLGGGLGGNREIAESLVVVNAQQIEASAAKVAMSTFSEAVQPSAEDLKSYWEIAKDAYKTDKQVKVSYFIATPEYPEEIQEKPDAPDATEKSEEEKTAEAEAKEKRAEERSKLDKELAIKVDTFINQLSETEGKDFDALIEQNGWALVATDWFTREAAPEELKIKCRATSAAKTVIDYIFELSTGPDALAPFSTAIAVGEGQWLVAHLDELEEPRVKTFEEAEEAIREQYIKEKADEALKEDINAKIAAIKEALAADGTFADAAKDAGLEVSDLGPFAPSDSLDGGYSAGELFNAASTVTPGELAEPIFNADGAIIVYVKQRQIIKDDNRGGQIDNYVSNLSVQTENAAFAAWLKDRLEEANITGPGRL